MKSLFEQFGGTYREENGYLIPNLSLPDEEQHTVGIWGQRHRRYLRENRKVLYADLLTSGRLNGYLADIDQQAEAMFSRLVKQIAESEGITEKLKADDMLSWVGRMNGVRIRVAEIVNAEIIYT